MISKDELVIYCKDLSPTDAERAVKFNQYSKEEAVISYKLFLEQNKLPRKIFIEGYNAMYAQAALFLAKRHRVKLDETQGSTHKNMRLVLEYYTKEAEHNKKIMQLYKAASEKFSSLSYKYKTESHFADRVIKDLMSEGYYQGKKVTYYSEQDTSRKDPLELTIEDAKKFIDEITEPFLFIMRGLTND